MLLDIPAVAATEGAVTNLTWVNSGIYGYSAAGLPLRIPGRFISGTFGDNNQVIQNDTSQEASVMGAQSAGNFLLVDAYGGGNPASATKDWVDQTSGAIFEPSGIPYLPPNVFIYADPIGTGEPFIYTQNAQNYVWSDETTDPYSRITIQEVPRRRVRQGSTVKILVCALPTFTVPQWVRSFTLQNISGADLFFRRYGPNVEANVIDTSAATFGEDGIVGQRLVNNAVASFSNGDFTPGGSWMLCASAGAANGAIVEFNP